MGFRIGSSPLLVVGVVLVERARGLEAFLGTLGVVGLAAANSGLGRPGNSCHGFGNTATQGAAGLLETLGVYEDTLCGHLAVEGRDAAFTLGPHTRVFQPEAGAEGRVRGTVFGQTGFPTALHGLCPCDPAHFLTHGLVGLLGEQLLRRTLEVARRAKVGREVGCVGPVYVQVGGDDTELLQPREHGLVEPGVVSYQQRSLQAGPIHVARLAAEAVARLSGGHYFVNGDHVGVEFRVMGVGIRPQRGDAVVGGVVRLKVDGEGAHACSSFLAAMSEATITKRP